MQTNLKIPKSLKDKLKSAAKENHRSMTAELVARLERSFSQNQDEDAGDLSADALVGEGSALYQEISPEELAEVIEHSNRRLIEDLRRRFGIRVKEKQGGEP